MKAIEDGLAKNALFRELNRLLAMPRARRGLLYADNQPELLYLVVAALQIVHDDTQADIVVLVTALLKGLVRIDCVFYHLAREWCRVYAKGEPDRTRRMRAQLLKRLEAELQGECREVSTGSGSARRHGHGCWSTRGAATVGRGTRGSVAPRLVAGAPARAS